MKSSPAQLANKKRYYAEHGEELRASIRAYDQTHRDERLAYHRDYYANTMKPRLDDRRAFLEKAKAGVGCADCGSKAMLDFHHRDPTTKKYNVGRMLMGAWCDIMDEIFECDVLCRSCHMKHHRQEEKLLVV